MAVVCAGRGSQQQYAAVSESQPAGESAGRVFSLGTTMKLDFTKLDGLAPAVIQDVDDGRVLMVGFMNEESFRKTCETVGG